MLLNVTQKDAVKSREHALITDKSRKRFEDTEAAEAAHNPSACRHSCWNTCGCSNCKCVNNWDVTGSEANARAVSENMGVDEQAPETTSSADSQRLIRMTVPQSRIFANPSEAKSCGGNANNCLSEKTRMQHGENN